MTPETIWLALLTLSCLIGFVKIVQITARLESMPLNLETRLARLEIQMEHLSEQTAQVIELLSKGIR